MILLKCLQDFAVFLVPIYYPGQHLFNQKMFIETNRKAGAAEMWEKKGRRDHGFPPLYLMQRIFSMVGVTALIFSKDCLGYYVEN